MTLTPGQQPEIVYAIATTARLDIAHQITGSEAWFAANQQELSEMARDNCQEICGNNTLIVESND